MKNIGQLPSEIISLILERVRRRDLYACALISSYFFVATTPLLWQALDIKDNDVLYSRLITDSGESLRFWSQYVRHVELDLKTCRFDPILLRLMKRVPHMESLQISGGITDASLQHVGRYWPNLKSIRVFGSCITYRSIASLSRHCHQLTTLHINRYLSLLFSDMFSDLAACPLESLYINLEGIRETDDKSRVDRMILDLTRLHRLTSLRVIQCINSIGRRIFMAPATAWPHLTYLYIANCSDVDDSLALAFMKTHPHLKDLFMNSSLYTDNFLFALPSILPRLLSLSLVQNTHITHHGLRHLIQHCPLLQYFQFVASKIKWDDFPELVDYLPEPEDGLHYLGSYTINIIRRCSDPENTMTSPYYLGDDGHYHLKL